MGKITFVEIKGQIVGRILFLAIFFAFGCASLFGKATSLGDGAKNLGLFPNADLLVAPPCLSDPNQDCDGDGVPNGKELEDGTDPLDSCSLKYTSIVLANLYPSLTWKGEDCDGDGVTNWKEFHDKTDPTDPCDYKPASITLPQAGAYLAADCDGDGVNNGKELEDGTDPLDPCDFILAHQNCSPSKTWKEADCDGDGVTNQKEKEDGTDPLDPCSYNPASVTLPQTGAYLTADCDGDGVTNEKEKEDGTDPLDPCEFVLAHQTVPTTADWNALDCDGDGVTNENEKEDGTDPLDPCSYNPASVTLPQTGAYLTADCDGDGVTNEKEKEDGTDPLDPCEFVLAHQTVPTTADWNALDCDGDGVTNENEKEDGTDPLDPCEFVLAHQTVPTTADWNALDCDGDGVTNENEKEDGTDPLDPCSYNPDSVTLPPSKEWEALDCDDDGNPNVTDPDPLTATARDDSGSTPAMTEVVIDILANDDFLPNNDPNNLGFNSLSIIGGTAGGTVSLDAGTGLLTYTPIASESDSTVTLIYQVCNTIPDPSVCASATVTITVGPESGTGNTIDAINDNLTGNTDGGTIPGSNVLANDTLNGVPVGPGEVVLTSTPTDELTINPDGSVTITPGIAEGTYTIVYTICEVADSTNCDTATVTVTVGPGSGTGGNIIDAVNDNLTGNTDGGTIPGSNVLANDTLNGVPVGPGEVVLTSTPTDELTINPDGSVTITPGIAEGTYTIDYTICEVANPTNCNSATVTVIVEEGDEDGKIEVNQLVTPNGDGKNDFLFIRGVKNAKNNTLQIYNRWGVSVYEGRGYNNQNNVFNGRSKGRSTISGNEYLPSGVYFYIFQYENKERNITDSGFIYVSK